MRQYEKIWRELKDKREVKIRCRESHHRTLIQAVMKEKSKENAPRKALDLPSYGRMKYEVKKLMGDMVTITFRLTVLARAEDL